MINIFLDDERYPEDVTWLGMPDVEWHIVRTALEFKWLVETKGLSNIGIISFDLDINDYSGDNGEEVTGYDLVKWLCRADINNLPECIFHTKNNIGRINMLSYYK